MTNILFVSGWVNQFLSWEAFEPLARLSYNIYLIHMTVMYIFIGKKTFTVSWSDLLAVSHKNILNYKQIKCYIQILSKLCLNFNEIVLSGLGPSTKNRIPKCKNKSAKILQWDGNWPHSGPVTVGKNTDLGGWEGKGPCQGKLFDLGKIIKRNFGALVLALGPRLVLRSSNTVSFFLSQEVNVINLLHTWFTYDKIYWAWWK